MCVAFSGHTHFFLSSVHSNLVDSKSSGLEVSFRIISSWNNREADINYIACKIVIMLFFLLSNISFGRVKETSQ